MRRNYLNSDQLINFLIICISLLVVYQHRYGLGMLNPLHDGWLMRHDWATNNLSWYFYRNEPWGFPIGKISNYFYPVGTNIGFTDIPLLDVFFKLLSPVLPEKFQFIGAWLFLSHVLMAYFLLKLFKLFSVTGLVQLLATLLIVINPVLIHRDFHPALCCHWLIIASLWIYFQNPETQDPKKLLINQGWLFLIGGLINPFFAVIEAGFLVALAWRLSLFDKKIHFLKATLFVGLNAIVLFVSWYVIGYFGFQNQNDLAINTGYGLYAFNLNALYNSFGFSSITGPFPIVSWHQYESFMYLGNGIIGLFFLLLIITGINYFRKKIDSNSLLTGADGSVVSLFPLFAFVIVLSLFAITNVITWNDKVLLRIPIPNTIQKIGDVFRASARFFWVAYYLILISILLQVFRSTSRLWGSILLSLTLIIQVYDYKLLLADIGLNYADYKTPLTENSWNFLFKNSKSIVFYPPYVTSNLTDQDYQYFCYLAAAHRKPITMGYVARQDNKAISDYMDELNEQLDSGQFQDQTLYIATIPYSGRFNQSFQDGKLEAINLDNYLAFYKKGGFSEQSSGTLKNSGLPLPKSLSEKVFFTKAKLNPNDHAGTILYGIDYVRTIDKQLIISGWASLEKKTLPSADSIKILLRSADNKLYIATSNISIRKDISSSFKNSALDSSGFYGSFMADSLPKGNYELAILINDQMAKSGTYTFIQRVNLGYSERFDPQPFTEQINFIEIRHGIDKLDDAQDVLKIGGWALRPDMIAKGRQISILLKGDNGIIYISPTHVILRADVTEYFGGKNNVDECGFDAIISKRKLPKGRYELGIYVKDPKESYGTSHFLGQFIQKQEPIANPKPYTEKLNLGKIIFGLDIFRDSPQEVKVEGWAALPERDAIGNTVSILLKSSDSTVFILPTTSISRPDVTKYFNYKNNMDESGFNTVIHKKTLPNGRYQLGFSIVDAEQNQRVSHFTENYFEK